MTGPAIDNNDELEYENGIPLDEMEGLFNKPETPAPPAPTDLATIKIDGDNVPAQFRGKSAAEIVAMASGLSEALKISEQGRRSAGENVHAPVVNTPAAPVYDRAAIVQMMEEGKTMEAMEHMMAYAYSAVTSEFDKRLAPLQGTVGSAAEAQARAKYAEDFELFGDDIRAAAAQAGSNMNQPGAWDTVITFVRGRPEAIEKIINHRAAKSRAAETNNLPPSLSDGARRGGSVARNPVGKPTKEQLGADPEVRNILRATGMSIDEYYQYYV